ncbi:MAG: gamma-glutamyl-gamma-aminobutyrate hydrolase family protein [Bryobacterales bacterium]|nr:gamma-glutamyl-gamma-aminobutyrate hydrolase family protein [Bryobacterales bacterium]
MSAIVAVTYRSEKKVEPYLEAVRAVGLEPLAVHASREKPGREYGGLVLTGGTDVDPALYGRERHEQSDGPDAERDELELALLQQVMAKGLPVLAICRGMQLLNVAHGGSLIQHLANLGTHRMCPPEVEIHAPVHTVEVVPETKLAGMIGAGVHGVNSRHHQAVDRLGEKLIVSARSPDGVIEGIERPDLRFVVGVQWHPEDRVKHDPRDLLLFEGFAEALPR